MTEDPIPVAVVGAGNMGANHVRVYDELPGAELVEVVETDKKRAKQVADQYSVEVLNTTPELEQAQAASIAVPNSLHREIAMACIEQGLDVLIEKPLATTVEDAREIVEAANDMSVVLQVGHIERYNPAVEVLEEILSDDQIIALEAHRLGPFNEHLTEESVVFDLMIHDIDIIRSLVNSPVDHVDAVGTQSRSEAIDHAIAHIEFDNEILGTTTSSHVTHSKIRSLTATTKNTFIELNYQEQYMVINRRESERTTVLQGTAGYRTETVQEKPFIKTREPLKNELEQFLECIRSRNKPKVDGEDGIAAVKLANNIVKDIRSN